VNCPKILAAASKFFNVWAVARLPSPAIRRKRTRKERDLRIHIKLPTLLRLKGMEKTGVLAFNPKR
jgi:hypothetical protein